MADVNLKGLEIWACLWNDAHFDAHECERGDIVHRAVKYVTAGILLQDDEEGMSFSVDVCETNTFRGTNFVPREMIIDKWKVGSLQPRRPKKASSHHPSPAPSPET